MHKWRSEKHIIKINEKYVKLSATLDIIDDLWI